MSKWKVPISWESVSIVEVEADTLSEAIELAAEVPVPSMGCEMVVDSSVAGAGFSEEDIRSIYNDDRDDDPPQAWRNDIPAMSLEDDIDDEEEE